LSPLPDVGQVARQPAGDDVERVDSDIVAGTGEARRELLGGGSDPAQAPRIEREARGKVVGALLDLDEGDNPFALDDEVDLAAAGADTPGEHAPAVQAKPPGGDGLRPPPALFRSVAAQCLAPSSSARA
jgi:hypothetical protein